MTPTHEVLDDADQNAGTIYCEFILGSNGIAHQANDCVITTKMSRDETIVGEMITFMDKSHSIPWLFEPPAWTQSDGR